MCKPSKNVSERLQCVRHCAQTYGEMGMHKTETLGADRMEDHLTEWKTVFVPSALIFHRYTKRDRSTEQGEVQEKGNSIFCVLKSPEDVS